MDFLKFISIITIAVAVLYIGYRASYDHFAIFPYCSISIREHFGDADKNSIGKALSLLRKSNTESYRLACKYFDKIEEKRCFNADGHIYENVFSKIHKGCYVKGTKRAYLLPGETAEQNAKTLSALSQFARDFWHSRQ